MKKIWVWLLIFILGVTVCCYAGTSGLLTKSKQIKLTKKVQFSNAKLSKVLTYLTQETGIKLSASPQTANLKVSLNFTKGSSLKQIIDFLKDKYNLSYAVSNNQIKFGLQRQKKTVTKQESSVMLFGASHKSSPTSKHFNTEEYKKIDANEFLPVINDPLSTFSIDVDTAAYANVRRFINQEQLPPKDAVRIEEMINYFNYDYPVPEGKKPFSITTEVSECPWNSKHQLALIGLQGKKVQTANLPPNNLVFLIDVSGSMQSPNKLPLLKKGLKLLVDQLRVQDRVSIVVYAGQSAVSLESTSGSEQRKIKAAIEKLGAGGSTAGSAGIKKAYQLAKQNFIPEGNNRVILATDGDFNVGVSSTGALVRMIEKRREQGIFLTTLGFGTGNYKGSRLEELSNRGNGNYAYIDNLLEAKKVLINEVGGTLLTIAKDVKIQVEFNPAKIKEYRLIGYENRLLKDKDFKDDSKDAGELGAGHSVTALYELVLVDNQATKQQSKLKYQEMTIKDDAYKSKELMTVNLRYKEPDGKKSKLITTSVINRNIPLTATSNNYRFASAVAEFGMLLRDSEFKGTASYQEVIELAKKAKGTDEQGYRAEFIRLVETLKLILQTKSN